MRKLTLVALFLVLAAAVVLVKPSVASGDDGGVADCDFGDHSDTVRAATFRVYTATGRAALGSAFHIGDGEWLTAAHVVEGVGQKLILRQGDASLSAIVHARIPDADLALLTGEKPPGHPALDLGNTEVMAKVFGEVYVVGYPGYIEADTPSVSRGILSRVDEWDLGQVALTGTVAFPGNSGGPLTDACGRAVGVVLGLSWSGFGHGGLFGPLTYALGTSTIREHLLTMRSQTETYPIGWWGNAANKAGRAHTIDLEDGILLEVGCPPLPGSFPDRLEATFWFDVTTSPTRELHHGWVEYRLGNDEVKGGHATASLGPGDNLGILRLDNPLDLVIGILSDTSGTLTVRLRTNTAADYTGYWEDHATGTLDVADGVDILHDVLTACRQTFPLPTGEWMDDETFDAAHAWEADLIGWVDYTYDSDEGQTILASTTSLDGSMTLDVVCYVPDSELDIFFWFSSRAVGQDASIFMEYPPFVPPGDRRDRSVVEDSSTNGLVEYTFDVPGALTNTFAGAYLGGRSDARDIRRYPLDFVESMLSNGGGVLVLDDPSAFVEKLLRDQSGTLNAHLWTNADENYRGRWQYHGSGDLDVGSNALVLLDALIACD